MYKSNNTAFVLLGLLLLAVPASGQDAEEISSLEAGAFIKITVDTIHDGKSKTETMRGTLVEWGDGTITLVPERSVIPVAVDRKMMTRLEHRTSKSRRGKSALTGFLVGGGLGALMGLGSGDDDPGMMSMTKEGKAATGFVTLGLLGTILGALIGPGEQWEDLRTEDLILNLGRMPDGKSGFVVTYRF